MGLKHPPPQGFDLPILPSRVQGRVLPPWMPSQAAVAGSRAPTGEGARTLWCLQSLLPSPCYGLTCECVSSLRVRLCVSLCVRLGIAGGLLGVGFLLVLHLIKAT